MSHFTKLDKAQITDAEAFIKACADLGFTEVSRNCKIKDFYGKQIDVDVSVKTGPRYSVALQKGENGKYDMVADWWGIRGEMENSDMAKHGIRNDSELQDALLRHTTKHTIISRYGREGFRATVTEDEENNLNVSLVRYR